MASSLNAISLAVMMVAFMMPCCILSAECANDCGPFGACFLDIHSCTGDKCKWECQCKPGYVGKDCSTQFVRCDQDSTLTPLDPTMCYNGGTCESYALDDGSSGKGTRCNCQSAVGDAKVFAGRQCEYPSQESCVAGVQFSNYAFCVNGGTCKKIVPAGKPHPLCHCRFGFAGRHCQFEAAKTPIEETVYIQRLESLPSNVTFVSSSHPTHIVYGKSNAIANDTNHHVGSAPMVSHTKSSDDFSHGNGRLLYFLIPISVSLALGLHLLRRNSRSQLLLSRSHEKEIIVTFEDEDGLFHDNPNTCPPSSRQEENDAVDIVNRTHFVVDEDFAAPSIQIV